MSDVTIYTIAKELNMTPSMVSRAFNPEARISEEKRQIVLEAARKYNFSPNKFIRLPMWIIIITHVDIYQKSVYTEKGRYNQ